MGKVFASVILLIVGYFAFMYVSIQWRLSTNGAIARELAESLRIQYPTAKISGGPSYEREVIYINVQGMDEPAEQQELKGWLVGEKANRGIRPTVELRFYQPGIIDEKIFSF